MAYCTKCGAQIPDGAAYCPSCAAQQQQNGGQKFEQAFQNFQNTADSTGNFDPQDILHHKGISVLSYIGFLFLIPLFAAKESRFAQFHANQGLVLFIAEMIVNIAFGILIAIFGWPMLGIRWILKILQGAVNIFLFVLMIMGIVNAANGKAKELPLIGSIHLIQ